ncbi:MAG: M28 family metallopeptidase [Candidatus Izemoplasmatales bacterium]
MKKYQKEVNGAFQFAEEIIQKTGPRLAGTNESRVAATLIKDKLSSFSNQATIEKFSVYQGAFLGWIRILVSCYALGVIFLWVGYPLISALLTVLSLSILVFQFFFYKPMIDRLYPKKEGQNVVATIEPTEEVKRQIIVSGHHDSARVFNFLIHQPSLYNLRVTGGISLIVLMLVLSLFEVFVHVSVLTITINIILSLGFLLTGQMWFFASKKGTPGAGDNLIASTAAVEIGSYFSQNRLKNTRVVVVSFDAEEEGLRGARAYASAHEDEFKKIPTTLLNSDCPYYLKDLFFLTSDINTSVELSTELAEELVTVAKDNQIQAIHKPIAFLTGGTDAGELAKKGVKATTLMAMPWSNSARANVYHTPKDTLDAVEKEAVEALITIYIEYIKKKDIA